MNSHSKSQRIAFIALLAAAIVLIAGGIAAGVGCVLLMWNAAFGGILL